MARWLLTPHGGVDLGRVALNALSPDLIRRWYAGLLRDTHEAAAQRLRARARTNDAGVHPARLWARECGLPVADAGRLPRRLVTQWERAGRPYRSPEPEIPERAGSVAAAHTYRLLWTVLNTAVTDGLIPANPCRLPGAGSSRSPERRPATAQEVALLAQAMPPRFRAAVLVAAWSGLRPGELFALRRRDVGGDARTLRVERTMVEVPGHPHRFGPPKSAAGLRTVHLPAGIARTLAEHLQEFVPADADALVFATASGTPVDKGRRSLLMRRARSAIGRDDFTWHHLRHTGMTLAAATGAPLAQLQRRLGHSTVRASLIYQHASDDADRLLADRLDRMLTEPAAPVLPFEPRASA